MWKGDPPRGLHRGVFVFADRAHGRDDRAGLRGSGDGGGGHAGGWQNALRRSKRACSRHGPGRNVCRWRTRSGSPGTGPAALACSHSPRPLRRPDDGLTIDAPRSAKTCDNPGRSSLLPSKTGARPSEGSKRHTSSPHLLRATVGHEQGTPLPLSPASVPRHERREHRERADRGGGGFAFGGSGA